MRQNIIHDFAWADQDWIGLMIFKNFADQGWIGFNFVGQDWTRTEKFHSPLIYAVCCDCGMAQLRTAEFKRVDLQ